MQVTSGYNRIVALVLGVAAFALAGWASADPPTRVARLGYADGAVSFSPAGENDWVLATLNRPLVTGDRLWADAGARAELQVGSAVIRMSGATSVNVLNLDDSVVQLELAQGTLNLHVRRMQPNDVLEIDTPNLAFTIRQPGDYRIDVDPAGDATTVVTRGGRAEVFGEGAAYAVDARTSYRFFGTGLRDYEMLGLTPVDDFDRWAGDRDRRWEGSVSARYVSPEVIGYQDLDDNGTWRTDAQYGNVWVPNRVAAGWSPYHDGHWAWIDPWGWTWVDDAPWGFAVSHYGRWTDLGGTWGWVPGPVRARAIYAPALVAFVGGRNFQLAISGGNVGGVAWFPLGPRDVYRPTYAASRGYFTNINTSNTVINNTQITNVYNNTNVTNITYVNQQVPGAVVAVPATAFVQSQPVGKSAVRMSKEMLVNTPVTSVAAVAPVRASVIGAAAPAGNKPPAAAMERRVVAKRAPPAAPVAFAVKERQLANNPGRPLDATELKALKPEAPVAAAKVQVIAPTKSAAPVAAPPERRGKPEQRGRAAETPNAAPVTPPTTPAAAPAEPAKKAEQRGRPADVPAAKAPPTPVPPVAAPAEPARKAEQRGRPAEAPAMKAPPAPVSPVAAPEEPAKKAERRGKPQEPPAAKAPPPPAPAVAAPPEQRGKSEQRGKPQEAPAAKAPPLPPAPAVAAPPDQRGRSEQRGKPPEAAAAKAPPTPAPAVAAPGGAAKRDAAKDKDAKVEAAKGAKKKSDEALKQEEEDRKRK